MPLQQPVIQLMFKAIFFEYDHNLANEHHNVL